jgi:HK97 family phage prohead protease
MSSEYQETDQELTVCSSDYDSDEDSKENDVKEQIRRDVFTTEAEAEARAEEIGCVGSHSHDEDGNEIFMPCNTHDEYVELTGRDVSGYKPKKPKKKEEEEAIDSEYLDVRSEIKAYDEDEDDKQYGRFEGYASVFNNTDLGNDVIKTGAFRKSLKARGVKGIKLLYQHKSDMPIGIFEDIKEDNNGLYVKGRLALKTTAGRDAYELLKMGAIDGMSIGFRANPDEVSYDKRSRKRMIGEVDLMEVSLVTFPMNPSARIRSVKGDVISIREWENGMRDAFSLSRSEAKMAAKAVHEVFVQRDVEQNTELVDAIKHLTLTLKNI